MSFKTKAAYNAYMKQYMARRYAKRKQVAIASLGGECKKCGTSSRLEFDHTDREAKEFAVTLRLASAPADVIKAELAKCQLLCIDCHREKTLAER